MNRISCQPSPHQAADNQQPPTSGKCVWCGEYNLCGECTLWSIYPLCAAQVETARRFLALCAPISVGRFPSTGLSVIIEDACGLPASHNSVEVAAHQMGIRVERGRVAVNSRDVGIAAEVLHELALERGLDVIENVWFGAYQPREVARFARRHHAALTELLDFAQAVGAAQ